MELVFAVGTVLSAGRAGDAGDANAFVRVSPRDARYFELTDGRPYVPVGLNMLGPRNWKDLSGEQCVAQLDAWMGKLAANGGNFARVWLSYPCWDVACVRSGQYEEDKARRIDALLAAARKHGIRLKLCLEHFREIHTHPKATFLKAIHHVSDGGRYRSMAELLDSDAGRRQFKAKLAWLARRFGQRPEVFGWELWNEMDCVRGGRWEDWTAEMLGELHRLLSRNLAMQSLGSYDDERKRDMYRRVVTMKGNDVAQVHRYLDCGARWEICRGPVDVLAADAVREMLAFKPARPVLLAESGAVEPRHSGPFKLYEKDAAGIILHDVLFAPFFAGAAGSGHCWHWAEYVDRNDLWGVFGGFAEAIRGIDPPAERFEPAMVAHDRLRVYVLRGPRTVLAWCRDRQNTWQTELADGKAPQAIRGATVALGEAGRPLAAVRFYDPWSNRWTDGAAGAGGAIELPDFTRSLVVRARSGR